ncbi:C40 family peptidase [Thermophagus sp. OGC60D27]|uniref:C40 family peptidase n=1 Tax=Thermophagus sp. OGC60D27 TaxID=3458415 RepID=UPI00403764A2
MKSLTYVIIITITILLGSCSADQQVQSVIDRFRSKYVGDSREQVFVVKKERISRSTFILRGEIDDPEIKSALVDSLSSLGYGILDSVIVLPHNVLYPWALIDLSVATMRASAAHTAPMVSQGLMGMPVRVLKEKGNWAFIQTPDRYLGWCEKAALYFLDSISLNRWKNSPRVMVTSRLALMKDPETGAVAGDVVAGCLLEETARDNQKIYVKTPSGICGFIGEAQALSLTRDNFPVILNDQNIKSTALSLIRTPYLWGGTSVHALDCSGFTKTVYRLQGVELPRDASLQAAYGKEIDVEQGWGQFHTGDLLFFSPRKGSDQITHVGLYLGDSEFIHEAGKVKVNSLDSTRSNFSPFRLHTLIKVRRIKDQLNTAGIVPLLDHPWYVNQ